MTLNNFPDNNNNIKCGKLYRFFCDKNKSANMFIFVSDDKNKTYIELLNNQVFMLTNMIPTSVGLERGKIGSYRLYFLVGVSEYFFSTFDIASGVADRYFTEFDFSLFFTEVI